jgi:hypothetical protein
MLWALALMGLVPAAFALNEVAVIGAGSEEPVADDGENPDSATETSSGETGEGDLLSDSSEDADAGPTFSASDEDTVAAFTGGEALAENDGADDAGDDYAVVAGSGETLFADFTEGTDHVTLTLNDGLAGNFIVEPLTDGAGNETGVSLSYATDEDETTLSFLGYDTLPVDDISVEVLDPESGGSNLYALKELGDFDAIEPNDPNVPDEAGPDSDPADEVIEVNNPDIPDEAGPDGGPEDVALTPDEDAGDTTGMPTGNMVDHVLGDEGDTLVLADDAMQGGTDATLALDDNGMPVIVTEGTLNIVTGGAGDDVIATGDDAAIVDAGDGNDTIYGGDGAAILSGGTGDDVIYAGNDTGSSYVLSGDEGADTLYGGDGDDMFLMDAEDTATGGAGADEFWLYYDVNADVGHAEITDFTEGADMLRITLDPDESYDGALDVEVSQIEDGLSSQVIVNGDLVAVLYGAPNVTLDDVTIEVSPTALSA